MQKCKRVKQSLGSRFEEIVHHQTVPLERLSITWPEPSACFTSIVYRPTRFRWSTAVSISGNRGKIRVSSVYHDATFVGDVERPHIREDSSRLSTRNRATQRVMICLWRITPRESRDASFFLRFFSLSLSVRGNLFRGTCKPSAIGSEANLKRGASSTEFSVAELLRDSFRATCETRSFFHASPPLSRSSIFFACFSLLAFLALLAYFFALLFLTCFPSLYCTDTNDGIENSTFSFSFSNGIK